MSFPKPLTEYADPCSVTLAQLITAYEDSIDLLYERCHKDIEAHKLVEKADPNFGDDIYMLRFVLSHHKKGVEKAVKALQETIKYRAKYHDILPGIRNGSKAPPMDEHLRPYLPGSPHFRTLDGNFIYLLRNGIANGHAAVEGKAGPDEVTEWATLSKEAIFGVVDRETRKRGKLVKMVGLMDMKGAGLSSFNAKMNSAMTRSGKESELYYPQLLKKSVIFNMPSIIAAIASTLLKLLPSSLQEKILICNEHSDEGIQRFCREMLHIDINDLPSYLGGKCECADGCVPSVPNAQSERLTVEEVKSRKPFTWAEFMERFERPATAAKSA